MNAEFARSSTPMFVSDLSEHGVFVHTETLIRIGAELLLRFTILLDDPVVLSGRCRVIRHQGNPRGMGVEFTALAPEMILRINDVVTQRRPRDSGPPIETRDFTAHLVAADRRTGPDTEDVESATTLVNLRAVDVDIIEEDGLPEDTEPRGMISPQDEGEGER